MTTMNLRENQQQIENTLAQSLDSAEGIHRAAAAGIFDELSQVAPLAAVVQSLRPTYESGAAKLFELGRTLNRSAGEFARAAFERIGL